MLNIHSRGQAKVGLKYITSFTQHMNLNCVSPGDNRRFSLTEMGTWGEDCM